MDESRVLVNLIRCFEGPRHDVLEGLWDGIAEHESERCRLLVHPNRAMVRHDVMLERLWNKIRDRDERYVLITEYDFLPDLEDWLPTYFLSEEEPVLAAQHCWRHAKTRKMLPHGYPGGWYILVDRLLCPDLSGAFRAGPHPRTDPGNMLTDHVRAKVLLAHDLYPRCYGVRYYTGTHMFFSRHLHDDPRRRIAGFPLGDIQRLHDAYVARWIWGQSAELRETIRRNLGPKCPPKPPKWKTRPETRETPRASASR